MNPDLQRLQLYPFQKLKALKAGCTPPADRPHIALSIGEPQHNPPAFVRDALAAALDGLGRYPTTGGEPTLREAIAAWLSRRFGLGDVDPNTQVIPVSGTREALFAIAQAVVDRTRTNATVVMPNPFYQIYEGATLLAGAQPYYVPCTPATGFAADFDAVDDTTWDACQLLYLCTPGNPTGAVLDIERLQQLIELAHRHDFIIASDECYSEIYPDEANPPPGLLQAAAAAGHADFSRCIVFHSLSKRSNLPGLRSGFVAGDATVLKPFLLYRTYQGCALPLQTQLASIAAWDDEEHVRANRRYYREKFAAVLPILAPVMACSAPGAGFYLWPETPVADTDFARGLYAGENVTVLPGSYLGRGEGTVNPGSNHIRLALVAELDDCVEAARRIRRYIATDIDTRHGVTAT